MILEGKRLYYIPDITIDNEKLIWKLIDIVIRNRSDITIRSNDDDIILLLILKEGEIQGYNKNIFSVKFPGRYRKLYVSIYAVDSGYKEYSILKFYYKGELKHIDRVTTEYNDIFNKYGLDVDYSVNEVNKM